jgi:hypothetical protein
MIGGRGVGRPGSPDYIDITTFGAGGVGNDDSAAIAQAINVANERIAAGWPQQLIRAPAGIYGIGAIQLPQLSRGGSIIGDGSHKTYFSISSSYAGDIFAWQSAWLQSDWPNSPTVIIGNDKSGGSIEGVSIIGTRNAASQQNAIMLYNQIDFFRISDVEVHYINGRALASGLTYAGGITAFMRESLIEDFRAFWCGAAGIPVVEFNSAGSGDASNEIIIRNMNVFSPYGPGVWLRNAGSSDGGVRYISGFGLRIEGQVSPSPAILGHLLTIGDMVDAGSVNSIDIRGLQLIEPYTSYSALTIEAPNQSAGNNIYDIILEGVIGPGPGNGANILAGRALWLKLADIATSGTNVIVGPTSGGTGSPIRIDGNGAESGYTYSIDSSARANVYATMASFGNPSSALSGASVPGNFTADKLLPITLGGMTYYLPARTATW